MDEEEAAGPMPLIGTLQADALAHVEAIRISLQVSWNADGKLGGASGGELGYLNFSRRWAEPTALGRGTLSGWVSSHDVS